ncbi:MAG: hypothetical protein V3T73_04275 [Dehalococcoidales bacterium]
MPGKSRRHRGKYTPPNKKRKDRRSPPTIAAQQITAVQVSEPAIIPPEVAALPESVPPPIATDVKHPDLAVELRRIGVLAGIMLAALLLLALLLG